jgi:hypothetical protein
MKKFFVLFSIAFALTLVTSCKEDDPTKYDPEEVVVTINTNNWGTHFFETIYFVVENLESESVFLQLAIGETYVIKRANIIKGDLVNLHFVYTNSVFDDDEWRISSYYDIPLGKEIELEGNNFPKEGEVEQSEGKSTVGISFSEIADFEVVTRSAMNQGHSHTLNTLEVPCAPSGNTFPSGEKFYVCLHNGQEASYKLEAIPDVSSHIISLGGLNSSMTKYSVTKNPEYAVSIKVKAYGSSGIIEIFNLRNTDESIFTGNTIDVYTPNGIPEMTSFSTTVSTTIDNSFRHSYYSPSSQVVTDYSFLEVGLTFNHPLGVFPVVSTSTNQYDYIVLTFTNNVWNYWNIFIPSGTSLYYPNFPAEVLQALPESFTNFNFSRAMAIDDTRFGNYMEAIDHLLKISEVEDQIYSTLGQYRFIQYQ